jgi:hypothetical protein
MARFAIERPQSAHTETEGNGALRRNALPKIRGAGRAADRALGAYLGALAEGIAMALSA